MNMTVLVVLIGCIGCKCKLKSTGVAFHSKLTQYADPMLI